MPSKLKIINYTDMVSLVIPEDHRIGNDILLLDEYSVSNIDNYEFVSICNSFIEVLDGEGYIIVDGVTHPVRGHCLIVYLKGERIRTCIKSSLSVQRGAVFFDDFMEQLNKDTLKINEIRYAIRKNPVIPLFEYNKYEIETLVKILRLLAGKPFDRNILLSAKFAVLSFFYGTLQDVIRKKLRIETRRGAKLSLRFFSLLQEHYREQHELAFYIDELGVTRQYLHQCVIAESGKAPGYWINQRLIKEARRLLSNTELKIRDVSDMLNFSGSNQFGRFFKIHSGMTPKEYRSRLM